MSLFPAAAMSFLLLYFAKSLLISALLYGYYRLALQNAPFHRYNRFFLLGAVASSLVLPLVRFPAAWDLFSGNGSAVQTGILHRITTSKWEESVSLSSHPVLLQTFLSRQDLLFWGYLLVGGIMLALLGLSLRTILRLSARSPEQRVGGVRVFMTHAPGTPFSFLNRIFWNERLDMDSSTGRQIFRHELFHVRQRHSADLLALETIRAIFWWNPFLHLIRKEIKATHEFLADQYAIGADDKYEYAELLVWQAAVNRSPELVHSFFNAHLKRRITMLTRSKNARPGYLRRIIVLPLAFLLFCVFTIKLKSQDRPADHLSRKTFTVVIDAGHGGSDAGARFADQKEKDINLAIAKKVEQLAPAYNINVLMTREKDELPGNAATPSEGLDVRTDLANSHKADLFISIHVNNNGGSGNENGMEIWLSSKNPFFQKSQALGSVMIEEMKKIYPTNGELKERQESIRVLEKAQMPAILVECGFMDNEHDLVFISKEQNQETIARSILAGILRYEKNSPPAQ